MKSVFNLFCGVIALALIGASLNTPTPVAASKSVVSSQDALVMSLTHEVEDLKQKLQEAEKSLEVERAKFEVQFSKQAPPPLNEESSKESPVRADRTPYQISQTYRYGRRNQFVGTRTVWVYDEAGVTYYCAGQSGGVGSCASGSCGW